MTNINYKYIFGFLFFLNLSCVNHKYSYIKQNGIKKSEMISLKVSKAKETNFKPLTSINEKEGEAFINNDNDCESESSISDVKFEMKEDEKNSKTNTLIQNGNIDHNYGNQYSALLEHDYQLTKQQMKKVYFCHKICCCFCKPKRILDKSVSWLYPCIAKNKYCFYKNCYKKYLCCCLYKKKIRSVKTAQYNEIIKHINIKDDNVDFNINVRKSYFNCGMIGLTSLLITLITSLIFSRIDHKYLHNYVLIIEAVVSGLLLCCCKMGFCCSILTYFFPNPNPLNIHDEVDLSDVESLGINEISQIDNIENINENDETKDINKKE